MRDTLTMKKFAQDRYLYTITALLFYCACTCMYNFYKSLSGFIANGFREPLVMIPIISTFALPALCFCVFFYTVYVRKMNKIATIIYAALVIAVGVWNCVGLSFNAYLYASNHRLGGYDTLLNLAFGFPYDGWIYTVALLLAQVVNLICVCKPQSKLALGKDGFFNKQGGCSLGLAEYLLVCVLAILVFVFVGAAVRAIGAFENALYDGKFIFLWLWVLLVPAMNLGYLVFKPEKRVQSKKAKTIVLGVGIGVNALFGVLLWVFEITSPSFMVHIAKPLFAIAFSVSLPIEMVGILGIMAISVVIYAIKICLILFKRKSCV